MEETATTSTPSAPTTPSSAAPATSAPSSSETPSQRPTFAEAFAQDAAPEQFSTPVVEDTATTAPTSVTTTESATGPIPFAVHKTALENARTKAAEAARAEFQAKYGWAESVDRAAVEEAHRMGQLFQNDKPTFIRNLLNEAMNDQSLAPLVRSEAARALGSKPQTAPAVDLSPDVPVMDADGREVTRTYSADRMKAVVSDAIQQALSKELGPIKQDFQSREQQAQAAKAKQELDASVQDIYSEAADLLPEFKANEAEIAKVFATMPPNMPADRALRAAWKQVVGSKLANGEQVKADHLKTLQTKAAASGMNPTSAAISTTKRPVSFNDPSLQW